MANLTMPGLEMRSARFLKFMAAAGLDRSQALGHLLLFWDTTRTIGLSACPKAALRDYLCDGDSAQQARIAQALWQAGYVSDSPDEPDTFVIEGNARAIAYTRSRRARGAKGAAKAQKNRLAKKAPQKALTHAPAPKPEPAGAPTAFQEACRATWLAYAQAYEVKTCHPPVRNAKLNGQIQQIVKRLGYAESPQVIRFYVEQVADKAVVESLWGLGVFLARAEGFATQYKMGRAVYAQDAQRLSDSAAYYARQRALLDGP